MDRPDWDTYFSELIKITAKRSSCHKLHVGCMLVKDNRIKKVIYISCNIKTLEKDFECLVRQGNYYLTNCCISNEFSGTEYNNSMILLEKNVL